MAVTKKRKRKSAAKTFKRIDGVTVKATPLHAHLRAYADLLERTTWRTMDSAPKDGTEVLVFDDGATIVSLWMDESPSHGSGWWDNGIMDPAPTHWMPLPLPPSEGQE